MVWKIKPMASGALTISEGLKGKTRKGRKVVLGPAGWMEAAGGGGGLSAKKNAHIAGMWGP